MDTHEGHEEGVREEGHLSREELGPLLCGSVPGSGEPAADAEERDGGAHARSDRPYTQRPAQADLVKEVVDQEGEREAADARPREDDTPGEPTPLLKPFGDEPDDGDVEDTPADADSNALQEDELPDLCVAWLSRQSCAGHFSEAEKNGPDTDLCRKARTEERGEVEDKTKPHPNPHVVRIPGPDEREEEYLRLTVSTIHTTSRKEGVSLRCTVDLGRWCLQLQWQLRTMCRKGDARYSNLCMVSSRVLKDS